MYIYVYDLPRWREVFVNSKILNTGTKRSRMYHSRSNFKDKLLYVITKKHSTRNMNNKATDLKQLEWNKLEWSTKSFKVSDFLRHFTLPQIVKVIEGFYGDNEESSLGADQILSLHCVKTTEKLVGRDYRGKELNIPLHCQNKVEVRPSNLKDIYENVEELCVAFPRYVRISQGYYNPETDEEVLNVGDKLQLKSVNKSSKGNEMLICINQNGQTVQLPQNCVAGFQPLADGKEYFIAEILKTYQMPFYIQFIDPPNMGKQNQMAEAAFFNSSLGPIHIENSYTENLIIASTISRDGQRTVVTFPRELDIRLVVCDGVLQNSIAYAEICQVLNHGMDLQNLTRIDMMSAFKPRNSVREFAYKELVESNFITQDINLESSTDDHDYAEVIKGASLTNEVKLNVIKEDISSNTEKSGDGDKSHDYMNEERAQEYAMQNKQTPPLKPQRSIDSSIQTEGSSVPPDNSCAQKISEDVSSNKSEKDDTPQVNDSNAEETASTQLDISHYSVRDVGEILKELGMDRYIVKFQSEMIDGEMMMCLNDDILMQDFGMNKLHCMKLKKYLEGWRPKV